MGKSRYYYRNGIFHERGPRGFVTVRAPIGAVVSFIPPGFRIVVSGGTRYFFYGDTYYHRIHEGYRVVPAPVVAPAYDWVSVRVEVLNVRSGPGEAYPVIGRVRRGRRLAVHGSEPGWFYVQLPRGEFGWVMRRFTSDVAGRPRG